MTGAIRMTTQTESFACVPTNTASKDGATVALFANDTASVTPTRRASMDSPSKRIQSCRNSARSFGPNGIPTLMICEPARDDVSTRHAPGLTSTLARSHCVYAERLRVSLAQARLAHNQADLADASTLARVGATSFADAMPDEVLLTRQRAFRLFIQGTGTACPNPAAPCPVLKVSQEVCFHCPWHISRALWCQPYVSCEELCKLRTYRLRLI
jgi:hypothetical protein